jgi:peptidoglycan hydrolase-like protein with peptidoglycan-binding domain
VTVTGPDGATATAIESHTVRDGTRLEGTGVYRFINSSPDAGRGEPRPPGFGTGNELRVMPGARYTLRVELPDGRVTTGETVVPGTGRVPPDDFAALTFNRDVDTLRLRWDPVPGARTYALRVETPYGAFFMFSDSASVALTGELRNLFADRLPRVFQAGFTQTVYVAAVDTNYFDYYRSTNSPFTGSGIINRLTGGIGLFGGYVPIMSRALFVRTAGDHDPIDGRYVSPSPSGPELLRVWVDSRGNGVTEISAAYRLPGMDQYGSLGTIVGDRVRLRALDPLDYRRVFRTIEGTIHGDTIFAQVSGLISSNDPGTRVFVKLAPGDTLTFPPPVAGNARTLRR